MLLNFCLGCKKKKVNSSSNDDRLESNESICPPKTNNCCKTQSNSKTTSKSTTNKSSIKSLNKTPPKLNVERDQVDCQLIATSPISICKFVYSSLPTPVHSINTDGSIRIKTNAINRALPDIPLSDLVNSSINTSINSTASAILNRSTDRSITPTGFANNQTDNLAGSTQSSIKYNCIATTSTSTFNPPTHKTSGTLNVNQNSSIGTSNLSDTQSLGHDENGSNKSDKHHSYARIKDNVVIDSSTENDTDDYYDSSVLTKRLDLQKVTINVPSANTVNNQSNENNNTSLYYAVSDNLQNQNRITNLELPYHISTINTTNSNHMNSNFINSTGPYCSSIPNNNFNNNSNPTNNIYDDLSTDEEPTKEVSYNKISVREPLAKVLADRAALIEHHYTEVYDENNSFYEEIAGSTNSSVTYTKIGDLVNTNTNRNQSNPQASSSLSTPTVPPHASVASGGSFNQLITTNLVSNSSIQIPVETSLLKIKHSSRSTSPQNVLPVLQTFQPNNISSLNSSSTFNHQQQPINCEALYTQVNKLAETNKKNRPAPSNSSQQQPINTNDLYAKVQKNLKIKSQNESNSFGESTPRKIHSSTPDMNHMNHPPPVPSLDKIPKNPKTNHLFTIKSNTNLNHPSNDTPASSSGFKQYNVYPQHKRSFSSSSQYQDNISDSDYYETFPKPSDNHNYETVKKNDHKLNDEDKEIIDAGYEIISYSSNKKDENSDEDSPCYETISPNKQNSNELDDNEYISEPDYEVIKTSNMSSNKTSVSYSMNSNGLKSSRKESDVSTADPGYERLTDYTNSKKQKINEDYEVVSNDPNHFIERL